MFFKINNFKIIYHLKFGDIIYFLINLRPQNQNVKLYVKILDAIGNAQNLIVLNPNVSLFVKILTVNLK